MTSTQTHRVSRAFRWKRAGESGRCGWRRVQRVLALLARPVASERRVLAGAASSWRRVLAAPTTSGACRKARGRSGWQRCAPQSPRCLWRREPRRLSASGAPFRQPSPGVPPHVPPPSPDAQLLAQLPSPDARLPFPPLSTGARPPFRPPSAPLPVAWQTPPSAPRARPAPLQAPRRRRSARARPGSSRRRSRGRSRRRTSP